jgi:elongation factor P--beta-lysine ligase
MTEKYKELIEQVALLLGECLDQGKFDYLETAEAIIEYLDVDAESFEFSEVVGEVLEDFDEALIALKDLE